MVTDIRYTSNRDREKAINFLYDLQSKTEHKLRVLDVGGWHNQWAPQFVTDVIDIFEVGGVNIFKGNINMPYEWQDILEVVEQKGKFDFCICTHTLEDIANPRLALEVMPQIAHQGFIAIPSKFAEFKMNQYGFRGSIHHRWIFNKEDEKVVAYPKINYLENNRKFFQIEEDFNSTNEELQFFWKESLQQVEFVNDDYLGPSDYAVMDYYNKLLNGYG